MLLVSGSLQFSLADKLAEIRLLELKHSERHNTLPSSTYSCSHLMFLLQLHVMLKRFNKYSDYILFMI